VPVIVPNIPETHMVIIFGKDSCPYTMAARDAYDARGVPFEYVNVKKNPSRLQEMLTYSGGRRAVPVIVDEGVVTIGFDGGT
jgi:glutaredoxin 3